MKTGRRRILAAITTAAILSAPTAVTANAAELHGRWVEGKILEAYKRLGGYPRLGNATTNELNAGRGGKFQVFDNTLNSIYWHPLVDNGTAHQVKGRIRDKWRDFGWENGRLKYPTTDELTPPDGVGKFNHFEGGSIYWTPQTGPHQIEGLIKDRWAEYGWEAGPLGYPTTDEFTPPDGMGRFNHFQHGSIYWHPDAGTNIVKGRIRDYWADKGWETGPHGYPTSEEAVIDGAVHQNFQKRDIQWVEPNFTELPTGDHTDWAGYQMQREVIGITDRWTPQAVAREVTEHFDAYFTFRGCGQKIKVGDRCDLNTVIDRWKGPAPVEIVSVAPDGFAFKSLPGHPEGADRTISFRFVEGEAPPHAAADRYVHLVVTAWGPNTGASAAGPLNYGTLARYAWGKFSQNLRERLNNAGTDYITPDKDIGAAQPFSLDPGVDVGLDSPSIDLTDEELSWVTDEVPLIPLDGSPAPEGIPQHVVDEVLAEHAAREQDTDVE